MNRVGVFFFSFHLPPVSWDLIFLRTRCAFMKLSQHVFFSDCLLTGHSPPGVLFLLPLSLFPLVQIWILNVLILHILGSFTPSTQ